MILFVAAVLFKFQPQLQKLFPHPTGVNGYEEYVKAGDLLSGQGNFSAYQRAIDRSYFGQSLDDPQAQSIDFLTAQVREVNEFQVVSSLVATGNTKPVYAPARQYGPDTTFPEMAGFKSIARFQAHAAYVAFADGRPKQGVDTLLDTLKFSRNISQEVVIAALVCSACESICLKELESHLNQLSLDDARTLDHFAEEELSLPPAALNCIKTDEVMSEKAVYEAATKLPPDLGESDAAKQWRTMGPDDQKAAMDVVFQKIRENYSRCRTLLTGPESGWLSNVSAVGGERVSDSISQALMDEIGIDDITRSVLRAEAVTRVKFHLLQLHAKVLEYRWLHGHLPKSLSECVTSEDLRDRICGGQFVYRSDGHSYILKSNGVAETGEITLGGMSRPSSTATSGGTPTP